MKPGARKLRTIVAVGGLAILFATGFLQPAHSQASKS